MMNLPFNPCPKPGKTKRSKPTQRQLGEISTKVREEVKERTMSHCELFHIRQEKCSWVAREMAHITSRKQLTHKTTAEDILHVCVGCHRWLDGTPEGIRYKRSLIITEET